MYLANTVFILPVIIINYLMYMMVRLCCGFRIKYPPSKMYTFVTELVCITIGLVVSLIWLIFNFELNNHYSFDTFYTVHAIAANSNETCQPESDLDMVSFAAQAAVSSVIIVEMIVAVILLNVAHCKIRLHVRGQQVLSLERRTHLVVIAVAIIYVVSVPLLFVLSYKDKVEESVLVILAIWFPIINECSLFILYITSIRTMNHPLFCLQRKKTRVSNQRVNAELSQTNPSSHPLDQPSHTTFEIQYTDGFTTISDTSGVCGTDSSSVSESTPLVKKIRAYPNNSDEDTGIESRTETVESKV